MRDPTVMAMFFCMFSKIIVVFSEKSATAVITDDIIIRAINQQFVSRSDGWTATTNKFTGKSISQKRKLLGLKRLPLPAVTGSVQNKLKNERPKISRQKRAVPSAFDARIQWPSCSARLAEIRDQGNCGCCWGTGVASVLSDRYCIFKSELTTKISVQDQLNCMPPSYIPSGWSTDLCNGFDPVIAMRMAVNYGLVTGGDFVQNTLGCSPFSSSAYNQGVGGLNCPGTCPNTAFNVSHTGDKRKALKALVMGHFVAGMGLSKYRSYNLNSDGNILIQPANPLFPSVDEVIMDEIMNRGSVTTGFRVYNDFFYYGSGIYQMSNAPGNFYLGGHVAKIIGWGVAGTTPYWTCVNSWGSGWGENGTFRILRGSNHVEIENYINSLAV